MANDELFCQYHISATERWLEGHKAPPEMVALSGAFWEEEGGRQLLVAIWPVELAPHLDETVRGTGRGLFVHAKFPYPPGTVVGKLRIETRVPSDIQYRDIVSMPIF